ncbi:hypothetical protein DAMA08_049430 [Martiniozyma asiatica (nom. inval.)]|nr:hypothetical protein DAMA08_049430 [Martiniozyma asiatica]
MEQVPYKYTNEFGIQKESDADKVRKYFKSWLLDNFSNQYNESYSIFFPKVNFTAQDTEKITTVLEYLFGWENINISNLTGGITNTLLACSCGAETVLIRLYGNQTNLLINRQLEFQNQLQLHSLHLASPIFARFENGLIYGFIKGKSLHPDQLSDNDIYPKIAQKLAQFHSLVKPQLKSHTLWSVLESWIMKLDNNTHLLNELDWLKKTLDSKSEMVMSHSDLLAGNIILNNNDVQFIDYEYLMWAPRAFDIANHFFEWQGFNCEIEKIPKLNSQIMRDWCQNYLGSSENVDLLIDEIRYFYGLPGLYWSVWSQIQSEISTIDFDYMEYSKIRYNEYISWKSMFINQ